MKQTKLKDVFQREGYRFCEGRPVSPGVYYKYYKEGFHVVLTYDLEENARIGDGAYREMETKILGSFYHPAEFLSDFPDGFPVYHVELLILLVGGEEQYVREICAKCRNVWAYRRQTGQLLIYENQPGDFFGLRRAIETAQPEQKRTYADIPYITVGMILLNVLVYLIMEIAGTTQDAAFVIRHGGLYPPYVMERGEWWRIFTAGFIHFGAAHLVNNMFILYCMGERLERAVGHIRLALIYMASLLGGNLLSYAMACREAAAFHAEYAVSAGASGAVFGMIGGLLWVVLLHRGHLEGIRAKRIIFMILLMIYYGFTSGGIDNWGHIGGVVTGFFAAIVFYHRNSQTC